MTNPIIDPPEEPLPVDQIAEEFAAGTITYEQAMVRLMIELVNGVWSIASDTDTLLAIVKDDPGEERMH